MSEITLQRSAGIDAHADLALKIAVRSWFVIAGNGVWIIAVYVTIHPDIPLFMTRIPRLLAMPL